MPRLQRRWIVLGGIVLGALALRLLALAAVWPTPLAGDELDYFWRAAERLQGVEPQDLGLRPPAMEFFYAPLMQVFGVSPAAPRLANVVLSVATLFPLHALGRALGGDRTGLAAAAIAAVYPNFVAFSHYLWSETLYVFLTITALALVARAVERRSPARLATAGLLFGLSALTRVVGLGLAPLVAAWLLSRERGLLLRGTAAERARTLVGPGLLLVAVAAAILPWTFELNRNGEPFALISRTTWLNMFIGNGEPVRGIPPVNYYETLGETRAEKEAAAREIVLPVIAARMPWWPFEKLATELPNFFTPTSFAVRRLLMPEDHSFRLNRPWSYQLAFETDYEDTLRRAAAAAIVAAYAALALAGAAGLVLAPGSPLRQLLLVFLLSQVAPPLLTFAVSRFRLASMMVLALFAAWLFTHGRDAWREASSVRRWTTVAACALMAGMILSRWGHLYGNTWA